jgi:hypothetical protein
VASEGERLATLEEKVRALELLTSELDREVNGPGNGGRQGLRQRVHAHATELAAIRLADETRARVAGERWSRRHKVYLALIATVALVLPLVNTALNLLAVR